MLKIALVDNDEKFLNELEFCITQRLIKANLKFLINTFSDETVFIKRFDLV